MIGPSIAPSIALWVALGAAVDAPARYLTDRAVAARFGTALPWGTFTVNVLASFVLGLLVALTPDPVLVALVGTGFCGAYSTYSTFGYEMFVLLERRELMRALVTVVGSVTVGIAAAVAGWVCGGG